MFDQVCANVAKAAEASFAMHQKAFKTWVALWPRPAANSGPGAELEQRFETTWADFCEDVLRKQWDAWTAQFQAGLDNIEGASQLASETINLWWKWFETLQLSCIPQATAGAGKCAALTALEQTALEQAREGLPPPRQVYEAQNRNRIDWSRFPCWAQPSDPELFESGHEG
jgi:hypothetical protein